MYVNCIPHIEVFYIVHVKEKPYYYVPREETSINLTTLVNWSVSLFITVSNNIPITHSGIGSAKVWDIE